MSDINTYECLQKGAIGAMGAIPGTLASHPIDLTKIRMQLHAVSLSSAMRETLKCGPMAGVTAGVTQKILTRGPMFFASEVCTQTCQKYMGLERNVALFVGSAGSGYFTGFLAAPAEFAKVQLGTQQSLPRKAQTQLQYHKRISDQSSQKRPAKRMAIMKLITSSIKNGQSKSLFRRMHGAGLRNAVFDSTFFGTEHQLQTRMGLSHGVSFAVAALLAVFIDYPLDVAVKRSMAQPCREDLPCGPLIATYRFVANDCNWNIMRAYRGLGCKGMEFSVSYFITGSVAPWIVRGFALGTAYIASSSDVEESRNIT